MRDGAQSINLTQTILTKVSTICPLILAAMADAFAYALRSKPTFSSCDAELKQNSNRRSHRRLKKMCLRISHKLM
jgi:hypothetical protein